MSRKIIGVTVGTPMNPQAIAEELNINPDANYVTESQLDRKLMGYMEYEGTKGDPPANSLLLVADGTNYLVPYLDEYYQLKRYNLPLATEDGPGAMSPEDKTKLENLSEEIDDLKAQGIQQTPLYAQGETLEEQLEWLKTSGDTSKVYLLSDGYLYGYSYTYNGTIEPEGGGYTNQIPISTDASGNVYNGKGYKDGYRFNSSKQEGTQSNTFITGFIPIRPGDTVYLNGNYIDASFTNASAVGHLVYDSNKNAIQRLIMSSAETINQGYSNITVNDEGYVTSFTLMEEWDYVGDTWKDIAFIRLNLIGVGEGCIVTVNEEIVEEPSNVSYTNLAEPLPDNTTDTTKWVNGYRYSSSGISAQSGTTLSNEIRLDRALKQGDVIRIQGVTLRENVDRVAIGFNRSDTGEETYGVDYFNRGITTGDLLTYDGLEDGIYKFTVGSYAGTINYFRFAMPTPTDVSAIIVTVNEEIKESEPQEPEEPEEPQEPEKVYAWTNTGHAFVPNEYDEEFTVLNGDVTNLKFAVAGLQSANQELEQATTEIKESVTELETKIENIGTTEIPDYWVEHLASKITTIKALQDIGGKDCYSFPVIADMHYPTNLGKLSPLLAKTIMDEIHSKYAFDVGDDQTRGCHTSRTDLEAENVLIEEMLAPIRKRLLRTEGNHDFTHGTLDRDGDGTLSNTGKAPAERETYIHNLTPAEIYERMYRQNGLVGDIHTDESGTACYVDDTASKTRYIVLNTQLNDYELQADGTQKYPKMWIFNFMQPQFDFLINEALVTGLTDDWTVQVFGHCPLFQEISDREIMQGVLRAYKNKTIYSGSYVGSDGYNPVNVNVDFTNAKGKLVGYFHGHTHVDSLNTNYGFNIIGIRCDSKQENDRYNADGSENTSGMWHERKAGTITEQSFDIFTVNKAQRKIYVTKIGAGSDRVITY